LQVSVACVCRRECVPFASICQVCVWQRECVSPSHMS